MSSKKKAPGKRRRYPRSAVSRGKILMMINSPCIQWKFARSYHQHQRTVSNGSISDLILVTEEEIRKSPSSYIRLTVTDFYMIWKWLQEKQIDLNRFSGEKFFFSLNPFIHEESNGKDSIRSRHYIIMEQDQDSKQWKYHVYHSTYIRRPGGPKIICLLRYPD